MYGLLLTARPLSVRVSAEYHGTDHLLQQGLDDLRRVPPDLLVLQQGANDAARDSIAKFSERLREFLTKVKAMEASGEISPKTVVWSTPPTRQYKSGGLPGRIQCLEGSRRKETCVETSGGDYRMVEGQVHWWQQLTGHTPLQFFGTIDRRRHMQRLAIPMVRPAPLGHASAALPPLSVQLLSPLLTDSAHLPYIITTTTVLAVYTSFPPSETCISHCSRMLPVKHVNMSTCVCQHVHVSHNISLSLR